MAKKRKLKKKPCMALVLFILLVICIPIIIPKQKDKKEEPKKPDDKLEQKPVEEKPKYTAVITNKSEQNPEKVKEYFAKGMSAEDYKKAIEKLDNYVTKDGNYSKIDYDFEKQMSYSELEQIYENLSLSDIVKLEVIGQSVDGRNMYSVEIGKGDTVTMFEAGIHAAEVASPLFITKYMVDLVNSYENGDEETIKFLESNKIVVLPSANPDGYEAAIFGVDALNNKELYISRKADSDSLKYIKSNANGVDLNRNFPSQTAGLYYTDYNLHYSVSKVKSTAKYSYYPGEYLGSEPETRAIMYWQNKWISKVKSYVALHSAGRVIYNGKPYLSDNYNDISNKCARIIGNVTGYSVLSKKDEEAGVGNDGTSSEYMAESLSGFKFSSVTGRLSSDNYAKYYDTMEYPDTCVIVIEALESYTTDLSTIKKEYYNYDLDKAYTKVIER